MKKNIIKALLAVVVMTAVNAHAAQIFYEGFEDPVVSGLVTTAPTDWTSATGANAGLSDGAVTGKTADQFAWVGRNGGKLETASLTDTLGAGTNYTFTCDVSASRVDGSYPWAIVEILAGTNVIDVTTNIVSTANDLSAQSISMTFLVLPGDPYIGETLGIRLGAHYSSIHNQYFYFDDMSLDATDTSGDVTAPTPTTMQWVGLPTSSVSNSITMQATNAVDVNGAQYYFTNTVNGNVSGWQDSPIWSDTGLTPEATYSYKVMARDKSANTNETNWSVAESTECEEYIILYESFEDPSILPDTALSFTSLPLGSPGGWTASSGTRWHNANATLPDTPFGEQYAGVRPNGSYNLTGTLGGHVLEANYTYRVTYNAGAMNGSGVPQSDRNARATLMAGASVVATNSINPSTADFSETNTLEFIPSAAHADLGEVLTLKLDGYPDFHQDRVTFDNVKVYAIPSQSSGLIFVIR